MLDPKSAAEPSPVERRLSVNRTLRRATLPEKDEHGASATVATGSSNHLALTID